MAPKVTIVIPFYNDPYITYALQSAVRQTYPNVEIVVVDDGSHAHHELLYPFFNKIVLVKKLNGGTASALNAGIRQASGDYIAWLSSDDMFVPHKIARQMAFMQKQRATISFTDFDLINGANEVTARSACSAPGSVSDFYSSFLTHCPVNGCTVVVSRRLLFEVGLFDESLPFTHDYDLWFRIALCNVHFPFLRESLTLYRWHERMGTMRHKEAVAREVEVVKARYGDRMRQLIAHLRGR